MRLLHAPEQSGPEVRNDGIDDLCFRIKNLESSAL